MPETSMNYRTRMRRNGERYWVLVYSRKKPTPDSDWSQWTIERRLPGGKGWDRVESGSQ